MILQMLLSMFLASAAVENTQQIQSKNQVEIPYAPMNFDSLYEMKGFNKEALSMHFTLYQGYVKNTNILNSMIQGLVQRGDDNGQEYGALKRRFSWEFNGMRLHEYYFENLGGKGMPDPKTKIYQQIVSDFGNYAKWKNNFIATGLMRGIGWVILYYDANFDRLYTVWVDDHNTGNLAGCFPILVMDVWEHAYITQFGLDRKSYIQLFFENIDWSMLEKRFNEARGKVAKSPLIDHH